MVVIGFGQYFANDFGVLAKFALGNVARGINFPLKGVSSGCGVTEFRLVGRGCSPEANSNEVDIGNCLAAWKVVQLNR